MAEELEFRRRLAEHEGRFLRPARVDLDELAATLGYRGAESGAGLWARAIAAGRIPSGWADDPARRFRATAGELDRFGIVGEPFVDRGGRARHLLATPPSARAALLFASDPDGLARAELLGRSVAAQFEAWGAPSIRRVAWRLAQNPVDRAEAGGPPLGDLRRAYDRLRAALAGTARIYEPPHEHQRFAIIAETLHAARRRAVLSGSIVPASVRLGAREVAMPSAVIGRSFAELGDPLGPWLELSRLGYSLWAITDAPAGAVLELAAPFPAVQRTRARGGPRAVWSSTLSDLRLACARGDAGFVRRTLPLLPRDDEAGQPKLIHFAVYGGPDVLSVLAELGHADLEARDAGGRTPLMLAAAPPREGPAGASKREIDVPISDLVSAASCEWLIRAGAATEACDALGQTALHLAASHHQHHAAAALVEGGASVDALDLLGRTPLLQGLAAVVQPELVEILLAGGADPDVRDVNGWTALHYIAATDGSRTRGVLARRLQSAGARPSRDRTGRAPADLCALRGTAHGDHGPLDPRTPVAAGPGAKAPLVLCGFDLALADELVAELIPDPGVALTHKPGTTDTWQVWADWLQSRGDPRGELVATSLACARRGARQRRRLSQALAELEQRCAPALLAGLWRADPLAPTRPSPIELERTHGFITKARLSSLHWRRRSGLVGAGEIDRLLVEAARELLHHEPLLTDLRLAGEDLQSWAILLAGLRSLEPAPRVRRLVLERLPATIPELPELPSRFPNLRELWLLGAGKLARGLVHWPKLRSLRLRHGDTSEWTQGGLELELVLPDLEHLDFALPVGMRTIPAEIEGCARTLASFEQLRHLRLQPLAPEFAQAIFAGPTLDRLRTLELVGVRGQTLAVLREYASKLRRLERVSVAITPAVAEQRSHELTQLQTELPGLVLA